MFIPRSIEKAIRDILPLFPIISLTGPRQSGKTTLLRSMFPDYEYVSLENADNRAFASNDPKAFLERYDKYIIIDEAQRVPLLFNYLQGKVDDDRLMGQYILSGSQNFLLLESITQSLAGRVAIFKLFPFDFSELSSQQLLDKEPNTHLLKGFYPAIYDRGIPSSIYYNNYIDSYVERDIRSIINVKDLSIFRLFLKLCAGRVGQLLNLNAIANECGISSHTVNAWLSILETSYIVYLLPPYYQNVSKRLVKSHKLYFWDTGLLSYLLDIRNMEQLQSHYLRGSIFENLIITEIQKFNSHHLLHQSFYFYRDSNQNEVDLMIQNGSKFDVIEIKSGKTINDEFFKGIRNFEKHSASLIDQKYLIYGGTEIRKQYETQVIGWQLSNQILEKYTKEQR